MSKTDEQLIALREKDAEKCPDPIHHKALRNDEDKPCFSCGKAVRGKSPYAGEREDVK